MARPKKEVPPAKEHFVGIRLTEDLYRVIQSEADNAGLSISEYFRRLATKHKIVMQPPIFHDDTALVSELAKLNKLGNNLNQIARYFNEGGLMTNPLAKELHHALQEIDKLVIRCNEELEKEYGSH